MSVNKIATLQDERAELQESLKEAEGFGSGTRGENLDRTMIKRQISRLDLAIEEAKPGRLTGAQKDAMSKRIEELKEIFKVGLPSKYEMDHPGKCPGAVRKHMKWLTVNKHTIEEWRNLQRLLNSGEEESIESLRKEK